LADDSMTAQNMGKKILTQAGYEVVAVSNGAAAVKKIAEKKPDLAVLDVYMPGYTGLEVCERLRNAQETTSMPVLLTVGKMETFNHQEATRVKADGIIIKPFEATDLLTAIQKLEEKLRPATATVVVTPSSPTAAPEYERTIKIPAPVFDDKDASYQAWKTDAEEHVEEGMPASAPAPSVTVPTDMQAAPMFAEELAPAAAPQRVTQEASPALPKVHEDSSAAEFLQPAPETSAAPEPAAVADFERVQTFGASVAAKPALPQDFSVVPSSEIEESPMASAAAAAAYDWEPSAIAASALATPRTGTDPDLPAPTPPRTESESPATAPGFEPTSLQQTDEVAAGGSADPALVTDVAEMSTAFPTKFGVEGAEPVHVGVASEYPSLYGDAPVAEAEAESASAQTEEASNYSTAEVPAVEEATFADPAPVAEAELAEPVAEAAEAIAEKDFDEPVATATPSGWSAEEAPLEEHETTVLLREEMQQQFAHHDEVPVEPEPAETDVAPFAHHEASGAAAPSDEATQELGSSQNAPDEELAAAMAAAVGSMEPAVTEALEASAPVGDATMPIDQNTHVIADIVHRVTERMRSTLIAEISKELEEIRKKR
jgi:CheY-like chemotaxis protein